MTFEIGEIKVIRKKLGLTQSGLAKLSGVSQSLIAKVEAGTLDPTYSNAKKMFAALESFSKDKEIKAEQIMNNKLISISPDDSMQDAVSKMKRYEISQMPVLDKDGKAVGMISETVLLDAVINKKPGRIKDIMDEAPPIISKDSSVRAVSDILRYYPMVLIGEKGRLKGIITKSDLLRKVYNK